MKPEAELAAGGDITVQDGLPKRRQRSHNNKENKELARLRAKKARLRKKLTSHDQGTV